MKAMLPLKGGNRSDKKHRNGPAESLLMTVRGHRRRACKRQEASAKEIFVPLETKIRSATASMESGTLRSDPGGAQLYELCKLGSGIYAKMR